MSCRVVSCRVVWWAEGHPIISRSRRPPIEADTHTDNPSTLPCPPTAPTSVHRNPGAVPSAARARRRWMYPSYCPTSPAAILPFLYLRVWGHQFGCLVARPPLDHASMDEEVPACLLCYATGVTKTPPGALKGKLDKQKTPSPSAPRFSPPPGGTDYLFNT